LKVEGRHKVRNVTRREGGEIVRQIIGGESKEQRGYTD
jgi:hypothetical protein